MGVIVDFPGNSRQPERYLNKREIAEYLGVGVRTVERYHAEGLPRYQLPGRNLYRASEVDTWLHSLRA